MILICGTWCLIEVNWVHQRIADISCNYHNQRWFVLTGVLYSIANAKCLALLDFFWLFCRKFTAFHVFFYRPEY